MPTLPYFIMEVRESRYSKIIYEFNEDYSFISFVEFIVNIKPFSTILVE